ncbi:MAG: ATP-binding protein [Ignavibacteriae bacterium]|nr:ATP-binding protein [Ignavibacteriota bacterium]
MSNPNKILFASSTKNLALVRDFIESKATSYGFDERSINQIILSVDEACTNIIKHAHHYDENKHIEMEIKFEKDQIIIIMNYKGKGFDPNDIKNPDMKEYFSKFKVGGLGVPIMKKFMNKIEYVHNNSEENSLTLFKSLQSQ